LLPRDQAATRSEELVHEHGVKVVCGTANPTCADADLWMNGAL
jgi:hypothetical protein